jgi:hypothetical protein
MKKLVKEYMDPEFYSTQKETTSKYKEEQKWSWNMIEIKREEILVEAEIYRKESLNKFYNSLISNKNISQNSIDELKRRIKENEWHLHYERRDLQELKNKTKNYPQI